MSDIVKATVTDADGRVLLFVPTKKDAEVTRSLLAQGGLSSHVCQSIEQLSEEIRTGAGAVLLTEEAIASQAVTALLVALQEQHEWSDLPVVILMPGGAQSPKAEEVLNTLTNVTVLERPAPSRSVLSAVQAAVRARRRQYEIQAQLTAIQRAEARSRQLQLELENAVNASDLGTFYCEIPLGKIVWNERCKAHFWLPPDADVDFDRFYSIIHPEDRERTRIAVEACVFDHQIYDIEYRTVSRTGKIRWLRASGRTTYDQNDNPVRFDGTTQDITQRKEMEEERGILLGSERAARMEAERANRLKDEFLATLSHELRTPLNAISGWTELLKQEPDDVGTVKEGVAAIERNVRAQAQLIEDLLDMSRIASGKVRLDVKPINIAEVVNAAIETVAPAARAKGVTLRPILDTKPCVVSADPGRLQQVIWNLLSNGVKFTPKGGEVQVVLELVNSTVQISISDSGEGIPPEFLPHIFERFSQADGSPSRRHGGLGLGLSIVKTLTEMHGGSVAVESEGKGKGSTFRLILPVRVASANESERYLAGPEQSSIAIQRSGMPALAGARVLVVDDEPDARQILRRLILGNGGTAELAASAQEAESLIPTFHPDVIVSDIGMPGSDGYTFIRDMRRKGITTPAVALTAFARAEDRIRAIQAGFQFHLSKPIDPAELMTVVASLSGRLGAPVVAN
jgi:signal transduction histidine kinase/CheY-like chemotaxis protein